MDWSVKTLLIFMQACENIIDTHIIIMKQKYISILQSKEFVLKWLIMKGCSISTFYEHQGWQTRAIFFPFHGLTKAEVIGYC